jgi:hypothetical protein
MVWLLAFVMIASHAALGAPVPEVAGKTLHAAAVAAKSMHAHCAESAMQMPTSDPCRHGAGTSCCHDKTCTCAQACVMPALATTIALPAPTSRVFALRSARTCAAIDSQPLRPPIA